MTPVFVIGTDVAAGGLSPWNVVEGTVQSLTAPGTVAIDRSYYDRLGVAGVGATSANSRPAGNGRRGHGRHSLFHDDALCLLRSWRRPVLHRIAASLYQLFSRSAEAREPISNGPSGYSFQRFRHPGADSGPIQRTKPVVLAVPDRSRRGARSRARCSASLSAPPSSHRHFIPAPKTIFTSSPRLRAMGASNSYIYQVIISQALLNAFIGFAIAALIGAAVVHFTAKSALQVVITPNLIIELFLLTIVMCIVSALRRFSASFASILRLC